ncbi:carboxylesterase [Alteraurantiacibacter aestuarii]|uniref:Alpha/beta fold hydrolase n=1 Tax=Alteraurantiacibacter aestuarii TaxID=650004 RepID=A0A844ZN60_9SPHN|nr:alpha/beta hydrolase [Alteraurantiacibacter aestuarii]MXO88287.1 alpha/beta fold hydrolase [Alteraurantiacibacter aestuarii]
MSVAFRSRRGAEKVLAAYRGVLDGWPVPAKEHRLPTCQGETFVLECGPQDAPPVILLHGAQANAAAWMADAAQWSRQLRIFAIDMIGEAGFSAEVRPPLDSDAHALWLDDVMAGLGLAQASFVGTSLGGWLALDYAVRRPQKVERLALIAPAGIGRQKNLLLKAAPLLLLGAWGKKRIRRMVFGPQPKLLPENVSPFVQLMELIGKEIRPRIVTIPRLSDEQLQHLAIPMHVALGGRDALLDSVDTRQRLEAFAPHARISFDPDGYHFLPGQAGPVEDFLLQGRMRS